jgi:hypothetical protein
VSHRAPGTGTNSDITDHAGRHRARNGCIWQPFGADEIIACMNARIKKTDDKDHYHIVIHGKFTHVDEEVDGSKLMAMLGKEELVSTTVDAVLSQLDKTKVGYEMTVRLQERKLC